MNRKEFEKPPSVGIIVPAYNEEMNIEKAIAEIETACESFPHETLVIDDGSTDATHELASKTKATVIRHPKNMGKGASLRTAINAARGKYEILVIQDADLTIPARYIPQLVDKVWRGESDIVYASRMKGLIARGAMPTYRRIGNRLFAWIISTITRQKLNDTLSGQKVFDARVLEQIEVETDGWPDFELIFKVWALGYHTREAPVSYLPRKGRSKMKVIQHGFWFIWQMLRWYLKAVILRRKLRWHFISVDRNILPPAAVFDASWAYKSKNPIVRKVYHDRLQVALGLNRGRFRRVLEVGTGSGISLPTLCSYADEVVAVDNHARMGDIKRICVATKCSPNLIRADLRHLPIRKSIFDQIIALSVLEHISDLSQAVGEIWRCLRPNSRLLLGTPVDGFLTKVGFYFTVGGKFTHEHSRETILRAINERFRQVARSRYPMRLLPDAFTFYEGRMFVKQLTG